MHPYHLSYIAFLNLPPNIDDPIILKGAIKTINMRITFPINTYNTDVDFIKYDNMKNQ